MTCRGSEAGGIVGRMSIKTSLLLKPRPAERWLLLLSFVAYLALALAYLWQTFGGPAT